MTVCKLPLDAKNSVCREKPNSQTVITEQGFDMKVQHYHWIAAWSGTVICFSWKPVVLCLRLLMCFRSEGGKKMSPTTAEELEFLNMSSSQESIVGTPPHVNQADVSLSVMAIFLWLTFLLSTNCKIFDNSCAWVSHADLAAVDYIFHAGSPSPRPFHRGSCASLLHFSSEVHRTAASFLSLGVSR